MGSGEARPRVFIGSSVEGLDIAYAIQVAWEHQADVTVWSQGVFEPSSYTLETLIETLGKIDFAVFVFSPDDVVKMRDANVHVTRDNVVFELGLFIGRLGKERNFIVKPRDTVDFHLPTDLLGLSFAQFYAKRSDENLNAALGPACSQIMKVIKKVGILQEALEPSVVLEQVPRHEDDSSETLDPTDCIAILEHWLGSRDSDAVDKPIRFSELDRELNLPRGATETWIQNAAAKWSFRVSHRGSQTITFVRDSSGHD